MKRLLIVAGAIAILTSCSSAQASAKTISVMTELNSGPATSALTDLRNAASGYKVPTISLVESILKIKQEQRIISMLNKNTQAMNKVIGKLKNTAGKTWYVFSGSTPAGWDCSGLVMWTYKQLGVTLEHRASLQAHAGKVVKNPVIGDIVAYYYPGTKQAFHTGVYIGNGKVIHAPAPGQRTRIESATKGSFNKYGVKVKFIRILATNLDGVSTL